jgi:hypothetical protein
VLLRCGNPGSLTSGSGQKHALPHCNSDARFSPISRHYVAGITQLRLGGGGSFGRLGSECGTGAGGTVTRDQPDSDIEGEI